jgi:hypothetical protein
MFMETLTAALDEMRNKATVRMADSPLIYTAEHALSLLEPGKVPNHDVPHGRFHHYHELWVNSSPVATLLNGKRSGLKLYPPGGYLSWHTNSDNPGIRVYFSYAREPGCWFRYMRDNKAVTLEDKPGWNIRVFPVRRDNLLWHCVWAPVERYSFGFNCLSTPAAFESFMIER